MFERSRVRANLHAAQGKLGAVPGRCTLQSGPWPTAHSGCYGNTLCSLPRRLQAWCQDPCQMCTPPCNLLMTLHDLPHIRNCLSACSLPPTAPGHAQQDALDDVTWTECIGALQICKQGALPPEVACGAGLFWTTSPSTLLSCCSHVSRSGMAAVLPVAASSSLHQFHRKSQSAAETQTVALQSMLAPAGGCPTQSLHHAA